MPEALRADIAATGATGVHIDANGIELHALDYAGDGPAVVVLPGITSPAVTWDFMARELGDLARVVTIDLRGRGLSDTPTTGYTLDDYVVDTLAVIDALGLDRPTLIGHSLGARIAAAFAAAHPDVVGHVIAIDPPMSNTNRPYPMPLSVFDAQLNDADAGTDAEGVARFYPAWTERERGLRARWLGTCARVAVHETHANFERETFEPLWQQLGSNATLVYGTASPVVTHADVATLRSTNPAPAILAVEGAGHMVPWDRPEQTLSLLRSLLHPLKLSRPASAETP